MNKKNINIEPLNDYEHWHNRMAVFKKEKDLIKNDSVIFLGDSITENFNLKYYFPNLNIINRGIGGDHIDGVIKRLGLSLGKAKNIKLFILIGINDICAGRNEETVKYLYNKMINKIISEYNYDIFLHSILPVSLKQVNCSSELIIKINTYIKESAKKYNLKFVNIYPLFKKENSIHIKEELADDGLHPNDAGYKIWADYLKNIIGL